MRTLAKAQAALGIAIVTYMPLRVQNLTELAFGTHLFVRAGAGQISTLELSRGEVKNKTELAYDIPPRVAKTLLEYRDRIAPKIIGHRPARLFVKVDGTAKGVGADQGVRKPIVAVACHKRTGATWAKRLFAPLRQLFCARE